MKRPTSIVIVGILFILGGILAVGEVVYAFSQERISPNLAVCLLFVGVGLLKLKASSRWWAVAWIGLGYLLCAILLYGYFLVGDFNVVSIIFGDTTIQGPLRFLLGTGVPLAFALLLLWMHGVLRRPEIRALFQDDTTDHDDDEEEEEEPSA